MTSHGDAFSAFWRSIEVYFSEMGAAQLAMNAGVSVLLIVIAAVASFALSAGLRSLARNLAPNQSAMHAGDRPSGSLRAAGRLVQAALWLVALSILLSVWGLQLWRWMLGPGAPFASSVARSALVLLGALIAWEVAIKAIEKGLQAAAGNADSPRRAAQLRSLAPMSRGAIRTIIVVFAVLIIISQFGVEIGPLLAGAGVVGVAVGFGAQTLVKDYLTGFSLILEDIVSVGDIARIGDCGGLVETMTLRTIRLRDFDGTLHVIPYSEAQIVHNLTKTFSYYVFDLPISYDSDIDKALDLMGSVGRQLQSEAEFKEKILEPIEVVGVDSLADSAVILKARIKTAPIQQWSVGREYNKRIKIAFDEAGVEIPVPHLKLQLSDRALDAIRA